MTDPLTQELKDKLDIHDVMYRYARMVDRREWGLKDSVFAPDATIDYKSTGGKAGPYKETLEWLDRALEAWPLNLHFITNIAVELDGDRAHTLCYFNAPMGRQKEDGSQLIITNAGYYEDDLVRTPNGWRISKRNCQQTIMIGRVPGDYEIPD
ncbi:MAG: nuclear transport factor 2 family protein [Proteobacteria bacterium]|nr:nuclear transport factor 2 family protein [Pseudomonadota bacterium]